MINLTSVSTALDQSFAPEEQYYSMAAITDGVCNDLELPVSHYFQKILNWGLRGLVELKMDTANCVKPIVLEISDVLTATLPADCVDISLCGVLYGQYFKELSYTNDLNKIDRTVANFNPDKRNPPGWLPNGVDMQVYGLNQFANYGGRALYAIGGGLPQRGHFTIVQRQGCKEILLDAGLCDNNQLYVEYIGLGINNCNQDTIVGPYLSEYVRCWDFHSFEKWGRPRNERSESAIFRTGRDLWDAEMKAKGRVNGLTPTDLFTISRRAYRLTNHA